MRAMWESWIDWQLNELEMFCRTFEPMVDRAPPLGAIESPSVAHQTGEGFMIKPFETVLVATDFGEASYRVLERAIDLAQRYEARLHLVHVWEPPPLVDGALIEPTVDWGSPVEQAARARLDEVVDGLRSGKLAVTSTLATGVAWEQIIAVAQAQRADLVVLGTEGRTGLLRAVLGSVAERVVRQSPVPVLTLH